MNFEDISLVCHSDWSLSAQKRWAAVALLQADRHWQVIPLIQVIDPSTFFKNLLSKVESSGCILAGFDIPIGLSHNYADRVGIKDFLAVLPLLGHNEWDQFFSPAETPDQISLHRPFYPYRPGGAKHIHLERGLGLHFHQLYRLCEISHENRRAACPLFWTLGAQQVGKAAIHGWYKLLAPALTHPELGLRLWPFSGSLDECCQPGNITIVETYPAEYYGHLGVFQSAQRMSKRSIHGRRSCADKLISWSDRLKMDLDATLLNSLRDGFGDHLHSEDQFDALIGLYGMINVVCGNHPTGEPLSPRVSKIEGWIFGQERLGSEF